jgi:hypothetical protein
MLDECEMKSNRRKQKKRQTTTHSERRERIQKKYTKRKPLANKSINPMYPEKIKHNHHENRRYESESS